MSVLQQHGGTRVLQLFCSYAREDREGVRALLDGNTAGAEKASRMALIWGLVGIVVGLIVFFAVIGSESTTGY